MQVVTYRGEIEALKGTSWEIPDTVTMHTSVIRTPGTIRLGLAERTWGRPAVLWLVLAFW